MSPTPERESSEPDYWNDGSTELDQKAAIKLLFKEPAIRNYSFAVLGSLAIIFLVLLAQGSDVGGFLIALIGISGFLFRWKAAPLLVLLILTYFMWTPLGIPTYASENVFLIEQKRFHLDELILVLSVLVYIVSQYRVYGLVDQAIAFDGAIRRKGELPTRRPARLVRPNELLSMLTLSVGLVVVGQLIWIFSTRVEVVPGKDFPLRFSNSRSKVAQMRSRPPAPTGPEINDEEYGLSQGGNRFFVLTGVLIISFLLSRLVFGYWRLRTIGPVEGGMILLDTAWKETHRERVRLEKWRAWGRKRAEAQSLHSKLTGSKL